jgi:hypothetical protein
MVGGPRVAGYIEADEVYRIPELLSVHDFKEERKSYRRHGRCLLREQPRAVV